MSADKVAGLLGYLNKQLGHFLSALPFHILESSSTDDQITLFIQSINGDYLIFFVQNHLNGGVQRKIHNGFLSFDGLFIMTARQRNNSKNQRKQQNNTNNLPHFYTSNMFLATKYECIWRFPPIEIYHILFDLSLKICEHTSC